MATEKNSEIEKQQDYVRDSMMSSPIQHAPDCDAAFPIRVCAAEHPSPKAYRDPSPKNRAPLVSIVAPTSDQTNGKEFSKVRVACDTAHGKPAPAPGAGIIFSTNSKIAPESSPLRIKRPFSEVWQWSRRRPLRKTRMSVVPCCLRRSGNDFAIVSAAAHTLCARLPTQWRSEERNSHP